MQSGYRMVLLNLTRRHSKGEVKIEIMFTRNPIYWRDAGTANILAVDEKCSSLWMSWLVRQTQRLGLLAPLSAKYSNTWKSSISWWKYTISHRRWSEEWEFFNKGPKSRVEKSRIIEDFWGREWSQSSNMPGCGTSSSTCKVTKTSAYYSIPTIGMLQSASWI